MPYNIDSPRPGRSRRRRGLAFISAVAALASSGLLTAPTGAVQASSGTSRAANAPTTSMETPPTNGVRVRFVTATSASIGDVVPVEVWADGAADVSGFEIVASVAPDAGRIVGAASDEQPGREDLSIADVTGFGVLAAFSPDGSTVGLDSTRLGSFQVRLDADGVVAVDAGAVMMVDAAGDEIAVGESESVSIQVGTAATLRPAAASPWSLSPVDEVRTPESTFAAALLAPEVQLEWEAARLDRAPCDGDIASQLGGCVDISDVQRAAISTASAATDPSARAAGPVRLTVNARTDEADRRVGDGVCATPARQCTLRAAIEEANAITGRNVIAFALPGSPPYRIQTTRRLPVIADASGRTVINGYTQPGSAPNTAKHVDNARILVEVVGAGAGGHDGFAIRTGGNVLRGLSVYAFRRPVWIFRTGEGARGNRIMGCFIGTDATGQYREPNQVDLAHGIHIEQGSPNTRIGGRKLANRNVISGNGYHGIGMWHPRTDGTVVRNNIIGLSPFGDRALPNQEHGIDMNFGVSDSIIGGRRWNERNVISGNDFNGVEMSHLSATRNNQVIGNFIGTTVSGKVSTPWSGNGGSGMWIEDGASNNIVRRNVMGGNAAGGIRIINNGANGTSSDNLIKGNKIGIARNGFPMPQGGVGVYVEGTDNVIRGNVIANNARQGVEVNGPLAQRNTITRNRIFDNGRLSIDLSPGGVNPNDAGDSDEGPNSKLNFPEFTDVTRTSASGTACAGCRVEVFAAGPDGSTTPRHGPAVRYLGAAVAGIDGRFTVTFARQAVGVWISSTATNPAGATSEMSANAQVP